MAYTLIDCGGAGDSYASGGATGSYNFGNADVSGVVDPVDPSWYQTIRFGDYFRYDIPNLPANTQVRVRLHFAEGFPGASRRGNYLINGALFLSHFSIYAAAGNQNYKAVVREAVATPTAAGVITIEVQNPGGDVPLLSAIEIIPPTPPAITTTNLPSATPSVLYDEQIEISGGTAPYAVAAIGGEIPQGLTLAGKRFQGNPTGRFGNFPVELRVTDAAGLSSTKVVYILVKPPAPVIVTTSPLKWAQTGKSYSFQLEKTLGTGAGVWSARAGNLPTGALAASGLITINPVGANNYSFVARFTDVDGDIAEAALTIPVSPLAAFDFCYRYPLAIRYIERERVFESIAGAEEVIEDVAPKREFTLQTMVIGRSEQARLQAFLLENRRRKPFLFFDEYKQQWVTVKRVSEPSESQMLAVANFDLIFREV